MKDLREILVGRLAVSAVDERLNFLAEQINRNIKPPRRATPDNVNIRVMYLLNDLVNAHGGRFRKADLLHLCRLIIDTPVLIGHDRSSAPLARNFHAELEQKNGILWLKSYFYWPKAGQGESDRLLDMMDSGVLKECSISFIYTLPECSECEQDIRTCPHGITQSSERGDKRGVHFIYNGITQVLETSLVYRGSVKGTYITDHLQLGPKSEILTGRCVERQMIPDGFAACLATRNNRTFILLKKTGKERRR